MQSSYELLDIEQAKLIKRIPCPVHFAPDYHRASWTLRALNLPQLVPVNVGYSVRAWKICASYAGARVVLLSEVRNFASSLPASAFALADVPKRGRRAERKIRGSRGNC
ncbi:hypothetical protein QAD02_010253 [Eretmocerus hayati]|uniref:Uncharacterized protein n=1 Tax=Eretmocerus hayati TaxID=131215 RepID=A0ACC2NBN7_9HYME|nr:hypothetical protein QAD02_010253 [Eretmocerus hayati]